MIILGVRNFRVLEILEHLPYILLQTHIMYFICILTSVDSDRPMQPPFKLRNSKLYSFSSLIFKEYLRE